MSVTYRKRARYTSPVKERWSLTRNDILLDEVYDYGVSLLADSESDCGSDEEKHSSITLSDKNEQVRFVQNLFDISLEIDHFQLQMAVLQSTISKETLKKISEEDWDLAIKRTDINSITAISK